MPLSEKQETLLHEIYGIPYRAETLTIGQNGLSSAPPLSEFVQAPREHLAAAILAINRDESQVNRVGEILAEYEGVALDSSRIDRNGYSFRHRSFIENLQNRLYPFTGVLIRSQSASNRTPLG
jgi:hypothetical protein